MRISIINYLACPICQGDFLLSIHKKTKERIIDGELKCKKCGHKIYIKNKIACSASCIKKQFERDAQELRKTTTEQEIPKKWMQLFSKQEINSLQKEWDWMLSVITKRKDTIHLDFATGTGRFLRNIIPKTKGEIIALDNGYFTCQELQYLLEKIKKYKRVSIICANAREMPFKNELFNSVSAWAGLDEPKMEKAIKEAKRVLKDGAYFTASGLHYQKGSRSFLRAKKYRIQFITKKSTLQIFKKAGFKKTNYKIFFQGKWNERESYLPILGDFYSTFAIKVKK